MRRQFPARTTITHQGTRADDFYLLLEGRARYFFETPNGKKVLLMWMVPGEILGGMSVLDRPSRYLASTEAVKDCTVLWWNRSTIRDLMREFPRLLENALSIAVSYIDWFAETHAALISRSAPERLALVLSGLARLIGKQASGGLLLDITNEELAGAANITLYTASRILSRWQKKGFIRKTRGMLQLRSPERLFLDLG